MSNDLYRARLDCNWAQLVQDYIQPRRIARESCHRLMWAVFAFNTVYSSGRVELTSCQQGTIHIQLPCREGVFSSDIFLPSPLA
jgi:hypothetical protein